MEGMISTMDPAVPDQPDIERVDSDQMIRPTDPSDGDGAAASSRKGAHRKKPRRKAPEVVGTTNGANEFDDANSASASKEASEQPDVEIGDSTRADERSSSSDSDVECSESPGIDSTNDAESAGRVVGEVDSSGEILPHRIVEAILMSADTQLAAAKIATIMGLGTAKDVRKHIETLNRQYAEFGSAFRIEEIAGGYQILTQPEYNPWLTKLLRVRQETKLTSAAMETLSVVAYKQPCTRADVEAVRGVAAGDMLNKLREMNLVKIVGRAEELGRPILYGTTRRFLEAFGLPSLEDLPQVEALKLAPSAGRPDEAEPDDTNSPESLQFPETLEGEPQGSPVVESD